MTILFLNSCKDDIIDLNTEADINGKYLKFGSIEEVYTELDHILSLDRNELTQYEETQGFESFYRKSEEIYDLLLNKQFGSQEEIFNDFAKYKKYVEIVEEDGVYEAVTRLSSSVLKYVLNEDQIVQVGPSLFKVFSADIVKTELQNYQKLMHLEELDLQRMTENSEFEVVKNEKYSIKKDVANNAGYGGRNDSPEQSKRRVKLELYMNQVWPWGVSDAGCEHTITPQKKILGIWFNYNATIIAEIKYRYDYKDELDVWHTDDITFTYNQYDDKIFYRYHVYLYNYMVNDNYFHFRGYDCTATTNDISNSANLEKDKEKI